MSFFVTEFYVAFKYRIAFNINPATDPNFGLQALCFEFVDIDIDLFECSDIGLDIGYILSLFYYSKSYSSDSPRMLPALLFTLEHSDIQLSIL